MNGRMKLVQGTVNRELGLKEIRKMNRERRKQVKKASLSNETTICEKRQPLDEWPGGRHVLYQQGLLQSSCKVKRQRTSGYLGGRK